MRHPRSLPPAPSDAEQGEDLGAARTMCQRSNRLKIAFRRAGSPAADRWLK